MSGGGTTCGTCGFGGQPHDTVHVRATTRAIPGIHNGGHNTHGGSAAVGAWDAWPFASASFAAAYYCLGNSP
jgi:hypothetical protein